MNHKLKEQIGQLVKNPDVGLITVRLEIENLYKRVRPNSRKERFAGTGWLVARVENGCRTGLQIRFGLCERDARYAQELCSLLLLGAANTPEERDRIAELERALDIW